MPSCRTCRLPNPLRATVEEGLGTSTMSFRQASKWTGVGLSSLHRHITWHWKPSPDEPIQTAVPVPPGRLEAETLAGPHSYPDVIKMTDQASLARRHSRPWPKVHNVSEAWAEIFRPRPQVKPAFPWDKNPG
jgi:hypothetical protein